MLQPQVQSLVTSSQVQPVTIQQQVQTVQAQRVFTQAANGTIQTLTPATMQTVAAPQVQQVPVSKNMEYAEKGVPSVLCKYSGEGIICRTSEPGSIRGGYCSSRLRYLTDPRMGCGVWGWLRLNCVIGARLGLLWDTGLLGVESDSNQSFYLPKPFCFI